MHTTNRWMRVTKLRFKQTHFKVIGDLQVEEATSLDGMCSTIGLQSNFIASDTIKCVSIKQTGELMLFDYYQVLCKLASFSLYVHGCETISIADRGLLTFSEGLATDT